MNPLIRDYLSQSLVDPFAPPQRLEAPLVGERIRQRAVTSVLPLWKFYKRDNKYVIPYVIDESIGKCVCVCVVVFLFGAGSPVYVELSGFVVTLTEGVPMER